MDNEIKILGDSWYANQFSNNVVNLDNYIEDKYGHFILKISKKIKILRGILFFSASKKFDFVITEFSHRGVYILLSLNALFSKNNNNIILLVFIRPIPQSKIKRLLWLIYVKFIFGPSLNKSLAKAHVLTLNERDYYSAIFNVPIERFYFIPWPFSSTKKNDSVDTGLIKNIQRNYKLHDHYVMVSGRLNVDWETIFEVAQMSDWQLLAVCTAKQLKRVERLNKNGRAIILHDISQEEHGEFVKRSTVYALCLNETNVSVGQIRLMNTNDNSVPVVASKVSGLDGYAVDGVNAILVPPNNVNALKDAIDLLMKNPELRFKLIESASKYQKSNTFDRYLERVIGLIEETVSAR